MLTTTKHPSDSSGGIFTTTHWTVVFAARDGDSSEAFVALDALCRSYWRPVYVFIRRAGFQSSDAQDLTQEFFRRFIEKEWIDHLRNSRGKFRSFLLTFLKHFLSDERDRAGAQKRGGGQSIVSLEELQSEEGRLFELSESLTADQVFGRRWAQILMERTVEHLRQEYVDTGKGELFQQLKELQPGEPGERSYVEVGTVLGMSESAVKSAAHRLRVRHREILRREIASTIGSAEAVDEEIRYLIQVLEK